MESKKKSAHVFLEDKDRVLICWLVAELSIDYNNTSGAVQLGRLIRRIKDKRMVNVRLVNNFAGSATVYNHDWVMSLKDYIGFFHYEYDELMIWILENTVTGTIDKDVVDELHYKLKKKW